MEKSELSKRVKAGMKRARLNGRLPGRRPLLTPDQVKLVPELAREKGIDGAAAEFRVHPDTIRNYLRRLETAHRSK